MGCWFFVSPRFEKQLACKVRMCTVLSLFLFFSYSTNSNHTVLNNKILSSFVFAFSSPSCGWSVGLLFLHQLWVLVLFTISSMRSFLQPLSPDKPKALSQLRPVQHLTYGTAATQSFSQSASVPHFFCAIYFFITVLFMF